jgi:hypothetical protein
VAEKLQPCGHGCFVERAPDRAVVGVLRRAARVDRVQQRRSPEVLVERSREGEYRRAMTVRVRLGALVLVVAGACTSPPPPTTPSITAHKISRA